MIETLKIVMKIIVVVLVGFLVVGTVAQMWSRQESGTVMLPSNSSLLVTTAESEGAGRVLLIYDLETGTRCYAIERAITCLPGTVTAKEVKRNSQTGKFEVVSASGQWNPRGKLGQWNPSTGKCEPVGTTWNPQMRQCDPPGGGVIEYTRGPDGKLHPRGEYGQWNPLAGKCEPDGTTGNPQTGQCDYAGAGKH